MQLVDMKLAAAWKGIRTPGTNLILVLFAPRRSQENKSILTQRLLKCSFSQSILTKGGKRGGGKGKFAPARWTAEWICMNTAYQDVRVRDEFLARISLHSVCGLGSGSKLMREWMRDNPDPSHQQREAQHHECLFRGLIAGQEGWNIAIGSILKYTRGGGCCPQS